MSAPPLSHFPAKPDGGATGKDSADAFLEKWRDLFVNESPAVAFEAIEVEAIEALEAEIAALKAQ